MSQEKRGKTGRNDACWCGSGRKYKVCHLGRAEAQPASYHSLANELKRTRKGDSRCMFPVQSGGCGATVIRAHSVAKTHALSLIARDGHVYQPNSDPFALKKAEGMIEQHLVGIQSATTFTGFCSPHDQGTFKAIDVPISTPTREQAFLLHYRALCRELYVKRPNIESNELLREADRGGSQHRQEFVQGLVSARKLSIEKSLAELEAEKTTCDVALCNGDYSAVHALVLAFDSRPTIACSGLTQPIFDFSGNDLQDLGDFSISLDRLSFTLIPSDQGGVGVLVWVSASDAACRKFAASLLSVDDGAKCSAIVQWIFDSFENYALQPEWWESLGRPKRDFLAAAQLHWTDMSLFIDSASLIPCGEDFADWHYAGHYWI